MFQCYLDDGGTSGLPVVTLAGFVGTLSNWESLEPKLDAIMDRFGVPVFHTKEFQDTKPPFQGWSKIKKRNFAEEIFSIAHGHICGHSMTLRRRDFAQAQKEVPAAFGRMSPLCVCFSAIAMRIVTDPQTAHAVKTNGVSFLVESGNRNNSGSSNSFTGWQSIKRLRGAYAQLVLSLRAVAEPYSLRISLHSIVVVKCATMTISQAN